MNQFFIKKVQDLRKSIPVNLGDPLELVRKLMRYRTCSLPLGAFHPDEILEIITKLKSTKSCGLDNIDSYIIKLAKYELLPVITHIVNLSVANRKFPQSWHTGIQIIGVEQICRTR